MREEAAAAAMNEDSDDEVEFGAIKKSYSIADITVGMDKTKISKKKKKGADAVMEVTKEIKKPERGSRIAALKQKSKGKRSRSQLKF